MRISEILTWVTVAIIPIILLIGIVAILFAFKPKSNISDSLVVVIYSIAAVVLLLGFFTIVLALTGY